MKTLGILGGGQLARMLTLKSQILGIETFILCPSPKEPAAQLQNTGKNIHWVKGDPYNPTQLTEFLKSVDVLTFESEFIPAEYIKKTLEGISNQSLSVAPSLENLNSIQDRLNQKQLLKKHHLNTADFLKVKLTQQSEGQQLLPIWEKLGPFVLKTRTGGYDGYGTFIFKDKKDLKEYPTGDFIAEKFIPFKRELALLVARNKKGQVIFTPLVESHQENSRCFWVKGPVEHNQLESLKKQIEKFVTGIQYEGILAFELFDTETDLVINELAPRVHNSGHYSLESLTEDQFTLHLKSILNYDLKTPSIKKPFAMINLLGNNSSNPCFQSSSKTIELNKSMEHEETDFYLWWYGKQESRKGRKMGHINGMATSPELALKNLLKALKKFKI